jgi:hypothetical protein
MPTLLPPDFWDNERRELLAVLLPHVEKMSISGAMVGREKLEALGIFFDDTMAHAQAAQWARRFTDELLNRLGTTNRQVVGEVLANWAETPGATMGQLTDQLQRVLDVNQARAAMIGTTEVTRAYAEGEDLAYQAAGVPAMAFKPPGHPYCRCFPSAKRLSNGQWVVIWQTNRDEIVCRTPINTPWGVVQGCRELHNVVISEGQWAGQKLSEVRVG